MPLHKHHKYLRLGKVHRHMMWLQFFDCLQTEPVLATVLQECVRSLSQSWNLSGYPVVVFGTTSEPGRIPVGVQSCFKHEVEFDVTWLL